MYFFAVIALLVNFAASRTNLEKEFSKLRKFYEDSVDKYVSDALSHIVSVRLILFIDRTIIDETKIELLLYKIVGIRIY